MLRPPDRVPAGDLRLAALAGLAAGGLALGLAQAVAGIVGGGSPVLALGSAVVDATPAWLKASVIAAVGTHDKQLLLTVLGIVVAALAALAGVVERVRRRAGTTVVAVLGVVTLVAVLTRHGASEVLGTPTVVGFLAGGAALLFLVDRLRPEWRPRRRRPPPLSAGPRARLAGESGHEPALTGQQAAPATGSSALGRRAFLAGTGATTALALAGVAVGQVVGAAARSAAAARSLLRLPRPTVAAPPVPDGVRPAVAGLSRYLTPNSDFYTIDTALAVPRIDPAQWSLRVHGLLDHELRLRYQDLLDDELVEARVTLSCVSNEIGGDLVGNATWLGVPISRILARARPQASADMVLSASSDGFTAATPLDALTDPTRGALLAIGMNGAPLPFEHGFPVRMVVPGLYGYVSATKWLTDLRVTRYADVTSYWSQRGWSVKAPVKTASRIDVPADGASISAGPVTIGGVAWAPTRGISAVQVQVDDGAWHDATLAADGGIDTWRLWTWTWQATSGRHTLTVRASDGTGTVQTSDFAPPEPNGSSGWHQVSVTVG